MSWLYLSPTNSANSAIFGKKALAATTLHVRPDPLCIVAAVAAAIPRYRDDNLLVNREVIGESIDDCGV